MNGFNYTKKEKQHYVWQHYLKQWTIDNKVWCLRNNKIFPSGLLGVANKRFFYRLNELTKYDIVFISKLLIEDMHPLLQELNRNWIIIFTAVSDLRKLAEKTGQIESIQKEIDVLTYNFEEDIQATIEVSGIPILDSLYSQDFSFLDSDNFYIFNLFLCTQYFRTNTMKQAFLKIPVKIPGVDASRIWNVSAHMLATSLAFNIVREREKHKYVLLINNTEIKFITSDQPIINTFADPKNRKPLAHEQFEMYYPLTPKLALLISLKEKYVNKGKYEITLDDVVWYNNLIVENSNEQVYSINEIGLQRYKINA